MLDDFVNLIPGRTMLQALDHDLRHSDDAPDRRRQHLRQLAALVLHRPTALVAACRAVRLHERVPMLAAELCHHALTQAADEDERSAVLGYASGLAGSGTPLPSPTLLTGAQEAALGKLHAMAELFFEGPPDSPIAARLVPLLVGASGTGKTHLVRMLGEELGCDVLRVTVADWVLQGSRKEGTLEKLRGFLETRPRAILHVDELDKFRAHNDGWSLGILGELYAVLDRDVSTAAEGWQPEHHAKLRHGLFLVGSGTWQHLWRNPRPLGFRGVTDTSDPAADIRAADLIPPELLNRFHDGWLLLPPFEAEDFRRLAAALALPPGLIDPAAAAASGRNFRFLENAYTEFLLRQAGSCSFAPWIPST